MRPALKSVQTLKKRREDFLHQVLGFFFAQAHAPSGTVNRTQVLVHGRRKNFRVALP